VKSFGTLRSIEADSDSLLLRYGVGLATADDDARGVIYAAYNPFSIISFGFDATEVAVWREQISMKQAESFAFTDASGERRTSDLFDRCTGLALIRERIIYVTYSPEHDQSHLVVLNRKGSVVARGTVPFRIRIVASDSEGALYTISEINGPSLSRYTVSMD